MSANKIIPNVKFQDIAVALIALPVIIYGYFFDIRLLFPSIGLIIWLSMIVLRYIYPGNYILKKPDLRTKKEKFEEIYNSFGIFRYSEDGMHVRVDNGPNFKWSEIITIIAFKKDLLTEDHIYLSVELANDEYYTIHESTDGWHQFIKKMEQSLEINKNWYKEVVYPPFERCETLVYQNLPLQKN